jgi:uncharacterized protein
LALDWTRGALAEGLAYYARADFFEAHEQWESVWRKANGTEKTLLHGLIQLAVALCHHQRGNRKGTASLLEKSLRHLALCPDAYAGIDVARLCVELRAWHTSIATNAPEPPVPALP